MLRVDIAMYNNGKRKLVIVDDNYNIIEEALYFSNFLYSQNYSPNTIDSYLRDLKTFLMFLNRHYNLMYQNIQNCV